MTDDGRGIAKDQLAHIWQRFCIQADASRSNQGSGLGLAMVQEIAQLHHGYMKVESVQGKGSCFTFSCTDEINMYSHIASTFFLLYYWCKGNKGMNEMMKKIQSFPHLWKALLATAFLVLAGVGYRRNAMEADSRIDADKAKEIALQDAGVKATVHSLKRRHWKRMTDKV